MVGARLCIDGLASVSGSANQIERLLRRQMDEVDGGFGEPREIECSGDAFDLGDWRPGIDKGARINAPCCYQLPGPCLDQPGGIRSAP
jgi:hypothetical protein